MKTRNLIIGIVIIALLGGVVAQYFYYTEKLSNIKPEIVEKIVVSKENIYIPQAVKDESPLDSSGGSEGVVSNTPTQQPQPFVPVPIFVISKVPTRDVAHTIYIDGVHRRITELDKVTNAESVSIHKGDLLGIKISELNTPDNLIFKLGDTEIISPASMTLYVTFNQKGNYKYSFVVRSKGYPIIQDTPYLSGTINVY